MNPRILLVDDEPATQFGYSKYLTKAGYALKTVSTLAEAREEIVSRKFDAILLDMNLPDGNGMDWIKDVRRDYPDIAVIVITGHGDVPLAVEAMRRGADHFLTKPVNLAELDVFLKKSLELGNLRKNQLTTQRLKKKFEPFFGQSHSIQKIVELATLASESDSTVLLQGETGTGKGVLARWIHERSRQCCAPFVEINCTSLKGELLASELFGHTKGAFTSAVKDKQGLIEVADGGTLFLDEISDMDAAVQAQFLKVIEEKEYRRLGEVKVRRSEFRLICATNRNLMEEIKEGRFRQDLLYRINVFPIPLPPLQNRMDDFNGLLHYLLNSLGSPDVEISLEAMKLLSAYTWPGNVREVKNVLERALLLARGSPITPDHLPGLESIVGFAESSGSIMNMGKLEEIHIQSVMKQFNGDTRKAAKALGMSRTTLYRRLKNINDKSQLNLL